jgi:hypothetical protein
MLLASAASANIWPLAVFEVHRKFVFLQQMKTVKAIQADSRSPFIRNFLISQNHINMKIGS